MINLTWHDQAILDAGVATNLSEQEVLDRFVFGDEARGAFDLTMLVDAQAHNSALCSHSDDGEEVTTVASLLVIDLTVTPAGMDDESSSALAVGTGAIPGVIFAPVFIAVVALVALSPAIRTGSSSALCSKKRRKSRGRVRSEASR